MRGIILIVFLLQITLEVSSQSEVVTLTEDMMTSQQEILLADMDGWIFKSGNNRFEDKSLDKDIISLKPTELSSKFLDKTGRLEGWFRLKFKLDKSLKGMSLYIARDHLIASDVYINRELVDSFGNLGTDETSFNNYDPFNLYATPIIVHNDSVNILDMHIAYYQDFLTPRDYRLKEHTLKTLINITGPAYQEFITERRTTNLKYSTMWISVIFMFMVVFWLLYFHNREEKIFVYISILSSVIFMLVLITITPYFVSFDLSLHKFRNLLYGASGALMSTINLIVIEYIIKKQVSKLSKILVVFLTLTSIVAHLYDFTLPYALFNTVLWIYFFYLIWTHKSRFTQAEWAVVIGMILMVVSILVYTGLHKVSLDLFRQYEHIVFTAVVFASPVPLLFYVAKRFQELIQDAREKTKRVTILSQEKEHILSDQNKQLEFQVEERTIELKQSLDHLQATQAQLIHSEKMASLGELTAGIAHEIQNPLNFVNNFSEVSEEMIDEVKQEMDAGDTEEVNKILDDLKNNLSKISHHGKRASGIVRSMLDHSRASGGEKVETDINALCDEYLRLAYHGMRAKDQNFNAEMITTFDESLPKIKVIPQDIGRVLLNLINNAFQAITDPKISDRADRSVSTKSFQGLQALKGIVKVTTKNLGDKIQITVSDNGPGIPDDIKNKIFQPFFTTKPTGEGTGLGLSLSYDIVKTHGGEIIVNTKDIIGTTFRITLPIKPTHQIK